jgi:hypothetical protein
MATLTITTTAPQDARIVAAFGAKLGLAGDASAAQVKADVIAYITGVVRSYEVESAYRTAISGNTPIAPT